MAGGTAVRAIFATAFILSAAIMPAAAQPAPSPEALKDLAPTGKLRAAINFGNGVLAQRGPNGEPRGITPDLAAKRLGVPLEFVTREAAGKVAELLATDTVDIGFIAIEPVRAAQIEFSPPYVVIEGTYMVRQDSLLKDVGDVDKPGVRIGVGLNSVYDLYLTRKQNLDAAAGVRQPLDNYAKDHPEMRVMKGAFEEIRQAMGTPKIRGGAGAAYLKAFIEEMKASGFVADALKRSNQVAVVAPSAK
jgi:polar amino acid transport system substrate-binding protein